MTPQRLTTRCPVERARYSKWQQCDNDKFRSSRCKIRPNRANEMPVSSLVLVFRDSGNIINALRDLRAVTKRNVIGKLKRDVSVCTTQVPVQPAQAAGAMLWKVLDHPHATGTCHFNVFGRHKEEPKDR
jgi:hypothetical protein